MLTAEASDRAVRSTVRSTRYGSSPTHALVEPAEDSEKLQVADEIDAQNLKLLENITYSMDAFRRATASASTALINVERCHESFAEANLALAS